MRLVYVLAATALVLTCHDVALAQSCQNIPTLGTENLQGEVVAQDKSCMAAPGGYVKAMKGYRLDFVARADGSCELRSLVCVGLANCSCQKQNITPNPQLRAVDNVKTHEYNSHQLSPFFLGMVSPINGSGQRVKAQLVDTNQAGTTDGPTIWTPGTALGKSTIRWTELIYTTNCNLQPGSLLYEFPVRVVVCKPDYNMGTVADPQAPPVTVRLPQVPILIWVPDTLSDLRTTVTKVADDYAKGLGTSVTLAETPCSGPGCVNVKTGDTKGGCARWEADFNAEGVITRADIIFPPDYRTDYPDESTRRRYMAHEVGHLYGLEENDEADCNRANSIMRSGDPSCGMVYSGTELSPQPSDFIPIKDSVYGTAPRNTCGF